MHWSLAEATEAGRLVQLLRAVEAACRVVIDYFGADAQSIDAKIQRFTATAAGESFEVYKRHAARAIMAMRAEDRAALYDVFEAVNREATPHLRFMTTLGATVNAVCSGAPAGGLDTRTYRRTGGDAGSLGGMWTQACPA